jgi:hypothetical protein
MNRLSAFFKGRGTQLGLFYPEHYLLAVFPNLAQADRAQEKLRRRAHGVALREISLPSLSASDLT